MLDASGSFDPDVAPGALSSFPLSYAWTCTPVAAAPSQNQACPPAIVSVLNDAKPKSLTLSLYAVDFLGGDVESVCEPSTPTCFVPVRVNFRSEVKAKRKNFFRILGFLFFNSRFALLSRVCAMARTQFRFQVMVSSDSRSSLSAPIALTRRLVPAPLLSIAVSVPTQGGDAFAVITASDRVALRATVKPASGSGMHTAPNNHIFIVIQCHQNK